MSAKQSLNHLLPYLEALFSVACTGLWLSVPFKKEEKIQTHQQADDSRKKKSIMLKLCLAEPHALELSPSSTSRTQVWHLEHRDGLSVRETNSSLEALSLFLRLWTSFSDNHTNWTLFSVSNFHTTKLVLSFHGILNYETSFCNYSYFCTTAHESLVPVVHFLPKFCSDILQMERDSCITKKRTVFLFFTLNKCYFFQIFPKQLNTEVSTLEQIFTASKSKVCQKQIAD